jgi:hypothetical protein
MGERTHESAKITELTAERDAARAALEAKRVQYTSLLASYQRIRAACNRKDNLFQRILVVLGEYHQDPKLLRWAFATRTIKVIECYVELEWSSREQTGGP